MGAGVRKKTYQFLGQFDARQVRVWESIPFCVLRIPICPAENSARQIGTPDKIR